MPEIKVQSTTLSQIVNGFQLSLTNCSPKNPNEWVYHFPMLNLYNIETGLNSAVSLDIAKYVSKRLIHNELVKLAKAVQNSN